MYELYFNNGIDVVCKHKKLITTTTKTTIFNVLSVDEKTKMFQNHGQIYFCQCCIYFDGGKNKINER